MSSVVVLEIVKQASCDGRIIPKIVNEFWRNFLQGWGRVTGNGWLDFSDEPDHGVDPGIFKEEFLIIVVQGQFYEICR